MRNRSLENLGLPVTDGRIWIKSIKAPRAKVIRKQSTERFDAHLTTGFPMADNVRWKAIYLQNCDLCQTKLFGAEITNCVFENCKMKGWGLWNALVDDCTFVNCDLRDAALGGIDRDFPVPNRYTRAEFVQCDLRDTGHSCESYVRCHFENCCTDRTDFLGAIFEDCVFKGPLEDTTFRSHDFRFAKHTGNRMLRCDLRGASLRSCQFLDINLDSVLLPDDPDIILLPRGSIDLLEWSSLFDAINRERKIWYVDQVRQHIGTPGIFNLALVRDAFSDREIDLLKEIVKKSH